jgi:hypothetical protein
MYSIADNQYSIGKPLSNPREACTKSRTPQTHENRTTDIGLRFTLTRKRLLLVHYAVHLCVLSDLEDVALAVHPAAYCQAPIRSQLPSTTSMQFTLSPLALLALASRAFAAVQAHDTLDDSTPYAALPV